MIPVVKDDYITNFNCDFEPERHSTALILLDMQYAAANTKGVPGNSSTSKKGVIWPSADTIVLKVSLLQRSI
jgi:hypothetical protein